MAGIIRQITELPSGTVPPKKSDLLHVKQGIVDVKLSIDDLISFHTGDYNNPHNVTKEQIGVGNCPNLPVSHTYTEGRKTYLSSEFAVNHLWLSLKDNKNSVPAGLICMWSGTISSLPEGWILCDGTNNTPNLKGRFIVGYNASDPDYNWKGGNNGGIGSGKGFTGGAKELNLGITEAHTEPHTLTEEECPDHRHWIHHTHPNGYTSVANNTSSAANSVELTGETIRLPRRHLRGNDDEEYVEVPVARAIIQTYGSHKHTVYVPEYRGYSGWEFGVDTHPEDPDYPNIPDPTLPYATSQVSGGRDGPTVMHEPAGHVHGLRLTAESDTDNRPPFYVLAFIMKVDV